MASLTIKKEKWKLDEVPDVVESAKDFVGSYYRKRGLDGITIYDTRQIYVNSDLKPLPKLETYIHEIVHAVIPRLRESEVRVLGSILANFLHRRGCRMS
jgi:hypothetical protein